MENLRRVFISTHIYSDNPGYDKVANYDTRKEVETPDRFHKNIKVYNTTPKYQKIVELEGFFHCFQTESSDNEHYTVAVIEKLNGQVMIVDANHIRFMDR